MSKQLQDAYIVAATRTPIGKAPRGMFKTTRPDDLLVRVLQSAMAQAPGLDPALITDAIIGCSFPEAEQGFNIARMSVLLAGLPKTVGGVTVNRYCASGITAIAMAADRIRVGEADVMIAGGVESMSMVPMMGHHPSMNMNMFTDENVGMAYGMGLTAEKVATQWKVSREAQDAFSRRIAPPRDRRPAGRLLQGRDHPRRDHHPHAEPGHRPGRHQDPHRRHRRRRARRFHHRIAGQAEARVCRQGQRHRRQQLADVRWRRRPDPGVSEKILREHNLTPLAKFSSFAVKGVPPEIMGIGPKFAIPAACAAAGITQDQLDWIELNEAFAAQALAVIGDLGLDPAKVNPMGGAIALGHPLGATGAIRAATVVHALRRNNLKYGMVTMCVGTGMGAAGIFERV